MADSRTGFRIDSKTLRDSRDALRLYEKATGKSAADTLNRFARNVIIRIMRYTPKAKVGDVRRAADPNRKRNAPVERLPWKKAAEAGHKRGKGIRNAAEKWFNRRMRSRGYIVAGFIKALRKFGGRSRKAQLEPGGDAARGTGSKATTTKLKATFDNFATGAAEVAGPHADRAFRESANDMATFAQKRMQKDADTFSARR